jgi:PAS domain S-box-containing protein
MLPHQLVHDAFGDLLDILPDAVVMVDAGRLIAYANPAVRELLGHAPADLLGQPLSVLLPPALRKAHDSMVDRFRQDTEPRLMGTRPVMHAQHRSGRLVPVSISLCSLTLGDGLEVSVAVVHKVAALRTELDHAIAQAETDRLTGLGNPLKLMRRLQALVTVGRPFSLLQVEMDLAPPAGADPAARHPDDNTASGKALAEKAMRVLAGRLQTQVREADVLVRVEGQTFAMLLDGLDHPDGLAERAAALARHLSRPLRLGEAAGPLSVHVGGAICPAHGRDAEALLALAGEAARQAREAGDAYRLAGEPPGEPTGGASPAFPG